MPLKGILLVVRPPLALLGFLSPTALLSWTGQPLTLKSLLLITAIGFGNISFTTLNEYKDRDVDVINKPWKPIPSGLVSKSTVEKIIIASFLISFSSLVALKDPFYIALGLIGYTASFVYNYLRKDVVGNMFSGTAYGIAALMCVYPKYLLFPLFFGMFVISFNMLVQYQDLMADKTAGVITAPQQLGKTGTCLASITLASLSFITASILYIERPSLALTAFLTSLALLIFSGIVIDRKDVIEWAVRRLGRLLLIVGFVLMLFGL